VYFCWKERQVDSAVIEHIPFEHMNGWGGVANIIKSFLMAEKEKREHN
jgi:hypothetical protein